jgi:nitrate reductase molybdenum cofactor assembly chaperone NarJ/NarW
MRTYQVLARLLAYPEAETVAVLPELQRVLAHENVLPAETRQRLSALTHDLASNDLLDIQERYVALFDRTRSLSLHLFEHVHGDSRDRGMAMVNLIELYRKQDLEITARELPDYLPLFLEFLSLLPPAEAQGQLAATAHILATLQARLDKRGSPYSAVFAALLFLASSDAPAPADDHEEDDSLEALDRAWEEAAVTFGPESLKDQTTSGLGCGRAAAMLNRMNLT